MTTSELGWKLLTGTTLKHDSTAQAAKCKTSLYSRCKSRHKKVLFFRHNYNYNAATVAHKFRNIFH